MVQTRPDQQPPHYSEFEDYPPPATRSMAAPELTPDDIVIAIMGVTGVGKSTFISLFNPDALAGESLMSCTAEVGIHEARVAAGQGGVGNKRIFLIDTPGFDDSRRSDTDILREIADWLGRSYQAKIKLAGIIYLHRIGDPRMGGAAMKNLRMFRKLCGDQGLSSVVLATTFWSPKPTAQELQREEELLSRDDFWGGMIRNGSTAFRQNEGYSSAVRIIQFLLAQRTKFTLKIQEEMAKGKTLDETDAGREVQADMEKLKLKHEQELGRLRVEMEEARLENDQRTQQEVAAIKADLERRMQQEELKRETLRVDMQKLQQERDAEMKAERERMHMADMKHKEEMWRHQAEMEKFKAQSDYEARLIEANWVNQMKEAELERFREEERERKRKKGCTVM